jgi:hypothetical protein
LGHPLSMFLRAFSKIARRSITYIQGKSNSRKDWHIWEAPGFIREVVLPFNQKSIEFITNLRGNPHKSKLIFSCQRAKVALIFPREGQKF